MELNYCGFSRSAYEMLQESVLDNTFNRTMPLEHGNRYNNEAKASWESYSTFCFNEGDSL